MPILGAWSDVTPDGDDFFNRRTKDVVDFAFLIICGFMAIPRNQDDSMQFLQEMWIPVGSFAIG